MSQGIAGNSCHFQVLIGEIANGITFDTTDDGDFIQAIADLPTGGAKLLARLRTETPAP